MPNKFGHLQDHRLKEDNAGDPAHMSLRERLVSYGDDQTALCRVLLEAFLPFLSELQGFDPSSLDPSAAPTSFGLDSLSAVSCQFWFHRGRSLLVVYLIRKLTCM